LRDAPTLSRTEPLIAYGAAFHAFDFLDHRYGDATVLRILDSMRVRDGFPDAFREALGISVESFATDFRRYLGWRGFVQLPDIGARSEARAQATGSPGSDGYAQDRNSQ